MLVGSVGGQRYWSSTLNLDSCDVTCGVWAPDDQKVVGGGVGKWWFLESGVLVWLKVM